MTAPQLRFDFDVGRKLPQILSVDEIFRHATECMLTVDLAEDRRIERKPSGFHGEQLGEYVCMWANTAPHGGLIALGIKDGGAILGCKELSIPHVNRVAKIAHTFCPDAHVDPPRHIPVKGPTGDDFVILLRVHYNATRVVRTTKAKVFIRDGDEKRELKGSAITELEIEKGERSHERAPCPLVYPDDFDESLIDAVVASYYKQRSPREPLSREETLELLNLGACRSGRFTPNYACGLLFARNVRDIAEGCRVRFLRFDGESEWTGEKWNVVKDKWIDGSVPILIRNAAAVIDEQLRTFSAYKDDKFVTTNEYPRDAWYEALVNACAHRSFGEMRNSPVFVKMFDDRLVVESPGGFPPAVTPANIFDVHRPRNPVLMESLYYLAFVKCAHEGTRRMRRLMQEDALPVPEFSEKSDEWHLVQVTLRNNIKHRRVWVDTDLQAVVGASMFHVLTEDQKRLINYVAENGRVNCSQANRLIGGTWHNAKKLLMDLTATWKILVYVNKAKKGTFDRHAHWVLRNPAKSN